MTRNQEAWDDVELAAKLLVNAQVPKLAGIIAFRLQQLETARAKLDESKTRNPADCETVFYLGIVLGELRRWPEAPPTLGEAAACLESSNRQLKEEIDRLRVSDDPPERKTRHIARREQTIAQQFAGKVASDQQFGERAREMLSRVQSSP